MASSRASRGASPWDMDAIRKMEQEEGVVLSVADQCMYVLRTWSNDKRARDRNARQRERFVTNPQ